MYLDVLPIRDAFYLTTLCNSSVRFTTRAQEDKMKQEESRGRENLDHREANILAMRGQRPLGCRPSLSGACAGTVTISCSPTHKG